MEADESEPLLNAASELTHRKPSGPSIANGIQDDKNDTLINEEDMDEDKDDGGGEQFEGRTSESYLERRLEIRQRLVRLWSALPANSPQLTKIY